MELRNRTIGEDTEDKAEEEEALLEASVDVKLPPTEKTGIAGDEKSILVLLFLYVLQGIPLGLAAATVASLPGQCIVLPTIIFLYRQPLGCNGGPTAWHRPLPPSTDGH